MPLLQPKQVAAGGNVNISPGNTRQTIARRICLPGLAVILGIYSLWQLTIELIRPVVPYFLTAPAQTPSDAKQARAAAAARIGWIRGDLWLDKALLLAAEASGSPAGGAQSSPVLSAAGTAAIRSVRLSPHDARAWLLLSLLDNEAAPGSRQGIEALKMSYYTGANDVALIPWRMDLAVRSPAIKEPDFQSLVLGEILAAMHLAALRPVIQSSYRRASPEGKRFLENSVGALDPGMLARMRAGDTGQ